jgi:hypothetical protein
MIRIDAILNKEDDPFWGLEGLWQNEQREKERTEKGRQRRHFKMERNIKVKRFRGERRQG